MKNGKGENEKRNKEDWNRKENAKEERKNVVSMREEKWNVKESGNVNDCFINRDLLRQQLKVCRSQIHIEIDLQCTMDNLRIRYR